MFAWRQKMHPPLITHILAALACLVIGLRTCSGQVAALGCQSGKVRYAGSTLPLLMGGVVDSCVEGCQPRDDPWSTACRITNRNPRSPTVRKCTAAQTQAVVDQLLKDGNRNMLVFTPCELHTYLQGRTLWLIGDSLMQNLYYVLRCFMLDFWDHSLGECQASSDTRTERTIYQAADTNISSSMGSRVITDLPRCLWLKAGGRICWLHSVRGEEFADPDPQSPGLLQTLYRTVAEPKDIFYVNFGRWHFNNCNGLEAEPYKQALQNLGKLYEATRDQFPNLIFKVSSHDHTACGSSARAGPVTQCLPASKGGYPLATGRQVTLSAENILGNFGVPIVNIYNETVELYAGHITDRPIVGREVDCIHYCSPGVPEFEIWSMYKAFRVYVAQPLAANPSSSRSRRRARTHAAASSGPAAAVAVAAAAGRADNTLELADLMVGLRPAGASSSSSSSSSRRSSRSSGSSGAAVSTAGVADNINDLIGRIGGRKPGVKPPPPPPPRCVPVTAKEPPPGWSYYYDRLQNRKGSQVGQLSMAAVADGDAGQGVLGTCIGGDEFAC